MSLRVPPSGRYEGCNARPATENKPVIGQYLALPRQKRALDLVDGATSLLTIAWYFNGPDAVPDEGGRKRFLVEGLQGSETKRAEQTYEIGKNNIV